MEVSFSVQWPVEDILHSSYKNSIIEFLVNF